MPKFFAEKKNFQAYQADKHRKTVDLIRGILSGSNVSEFYSKLQDCPAPLKRIAFAEAITNSKDERLLLVLSALSPHSDDRIV